jgi:hypothetical protein
MRKVFLSLATVLASSSLMLGVAAAAPSCQLSDTGPDSFNECTNDETSTITITCKNNAEILTINGQVATSGSATVNSVTNAGSAQSGNASNINFDYTTADISCAPAEAAEETPAPAPAPVVAAVVTPPASTGGQGEAQQTPKVQALPETGNNSAITLATIATVTVGLASAAARFGFSAYKSFNVK